MHWLKDCVSFGGGRHFGGYCVAMATSILLGGTASASVEPELLKVQPMAIQTERIVTTGKLWPWEHANKMFTERWKEDLRQNNLRPPERTSQERNDGGQISQPTPAENTATCPATGKPVILSTGEKWKSETDFVSGGKYGLSMSRTYRSNNNAAGLFGPNWRSSLDIPRLSFTFAGCTTSPIGHCIPQTVTHSNEDGVKQIYTYGGWTDDGSFYTYSVNGATATGQLTWVYGNRWILSRDKVTYTYNNTGYIQSITDSAGAKTTFGYTGSNITSVTNAVGQNIALTWANGHVTSVRDPAGNYWNYSYDSNGMLTSVTSPGIDPDIRNYLYEKAAIDFRLLTGIVINGVRYSTYDYYTDRRVKESGLAGGEDRDTFEYLTNQTKVTSSVGQATTYNFAQIQGSLKLTGVSRAATPTCGLTSAQTVYDANGYIDYTLDWNQVKTDYNYDATGRLSSVTAAAGTPSALTTVNTWQDDNLVEASFRTAAGAEYRRVTYTYYASTSGLMRGLIASVTVADIVYGGSRQTNYDYTFHPNKALATVTITQSLASGNAVSVSAYDTLGNLISYTNALGQVASWSNYSGMGQAGGSTDLNGVTTDSATTQKVT